jgi:hypothetical protein
MFLKRLFYASASLLMLSVAYHLGASTASGQTPSFRVLWLTDVLSGDTFYHLNPVHGWVPTAAIDVPPVPPNSLISFSSANHLAITESGEGWYWFNGWRSAGIVPGGATLTRTESFGALKARYR